MGLNAGGLCASLMPLQLKSYISSVTRNAILQSYPMFPSTRGLKSLCENSAYKPGSVTKAGCPTSPISCET